jgi:EAL domain-containing protein (putative c-di-GMP-specific phosphodiesterase class I)
VVAALGEAGVSPTRMEVEITESMLISQHDLAISLLKSLMELGVTLALDDFGTGFSSLTYLRRLPFSRIKIDQSFVRDMLTQPDCAAIVKSVIALAKDLHIEVVAGGVESSEQLEFLQRNRCDEVQGYLFGRPMIFDRTKVFLDELKDLGINAA